MKSYNINGKTYTQKPLVIGQVADMKNLIAGIQIVDLSPLGIIQSLGDKLPMALAVVLIPEGAKVKNRDLLAIAEEMEENLDIDTALEMAADFLSFNPLSSISSKSRGLIDKVWQMMPKRDKETGSSRSSKNFATETLQSVPGSPGTSH
jgi:hypothetical protein